MTLNGSHGGKQKAPSKRQERKLQDVWASNLEDEIERIQSSLEGFSHVAMDTLLPGIVARPTGPFDAYAHYNYQTLKSNVDLTRALQISFTICDDKGNRPKGISTWRFNFMFDASKDLLVQELTGVEGLDLGRARDQGIDAAVFGELLMSSGLVLNDEVKWIIYCGTCNFADRAPEERVPGRAGGEPATTTFCGLYNFAYLLQFLTSQPLSEDFTGFYESLDLFFPARCDLAQFLSHLPPGPPLSSRDPADTLKRPLFCNGGQLQEAFFRLPDVVRGRAFDPSEEPRAGAQVQRRQDGKGVASAGATVARAARVGGGG